MAQKKKKNPEDLSDFPDQPVEDLSDFPDQPGFASGYTIPRVKDIERIAEKTVTGAGKLGLSALDILTSPFGGDDSPFGLRQAIKTGHERLVGLEKEIGKTTSPESQAAREELGRAQGFGGALKTIGRHPGLAVETGLEAIPYMLGGRGIAGAAIKAAPKLAPWAAGAIGEGTITGLSQASDIREQTGDLSALQALLALGGGALTGAISGASGKLANKTGFGDIDIPGAIGRRGALGRIGSAGFETGEEILQSAQEQAGLNLATGKPIGEGVPQAAAIGGVVGGLMGGLAPHGAKPPMGRTLQERYPAAPGVFTTSYSSVNLPEEAFVKEPRGPDWRPPPDEPPPLDVRPPGGPSPIPEFATAMERTQAAPPPAPAIEEPAVEEDIPTEQKFAGEADTKVLPYNPDTLEILVANMKKGGYQLYTLAKDGKAVFKRFIKDEGGYFDWEALKNNLRMMLGREPTETEVTQEAFKRGPSGQIDKYEQARQQMLSEGRSPEEVERILAESRKIDEDVRAGRVPAEFTRALNLPQPLEPTNEFGETAAEIRQSIIDWTDQRAMAKSQEEDDDLTYLIETAKKQLEAMEAQARFDNMTVADVDAQAAEAARQAAETKAEGERLFGAPEGYPPVESGWPSPALPMWDKPRPLQMGQQELPWSRGGPFGTAPDEGANFELIPPPNEVQQELDFGPPPAMEDFVPPRLPFAEEKLRRGYRTLSGSEESPPRDIADEEWFEMGPLALWRRGIALTQRQEPLTNEEIQELSEIGRFFREHPELKQMVVDDATEIAGAGKKPAWRWDVGDPIPENPNDPKWDNFHEKNPNHTTDYRLPSGRIVKIRTEVARGQQTMDFGLKDGSTVKATRVHEGEVVSEEGTTDERVYRKYPYLQDMSTIEKWDRWQSAGSAQEALEIGNLFTMHPEWMADVRRDLFKRHHPNETRAIIDRVRGMDPAEMRSKYDELEGKGALTSEEMIERDALKELLIPESGKKWKWDTELKRFIEDEGGALDVERMRELWRGAKGYTGWGQGISGQRAGKDDVNIIKEAFMLPSNVTTTGDLSPMGRQGLTMINTRQFWEALLPAAKSLHYGTWQKLDAALHQMKNFKRLIDPVTKKEIPSLAERVGVKIYRPASEVGPRAEGVASRWVETGGFLGPEKIGRFTNPARAAWSGTLGKYLIRPTNRFYITFLNHLRANRFNYLMDRAEDISLAALSDPNMRAPMQGLLGGEKIFGQQIGFKRQYSVDEALENNPYTNLTKAKEIADFINTATGQAPLKTHILPFKRAEIGLEAAAENMALAIFSPGMLASRVRMMNPSTYIMASPFVRKQYLKAMMGAVMGWAAMLMLIKNAGGEDVSISWDDTNADFGKARIGNTRLDPGGGFLQFYVLAARMLRGGWTSSSNPEEGMHDFGVGFNPKTQMSNLIQFGTNKLNPAVKFGWDWLDASENKPMYVRDRIAQLFVPLFAQDVLELWQNNPEMLGYALPVLFGAGTQTYGKYGDYLEEDKGRLWPLISDEPDWVKTGGGVFEFGPPPEGY